MYKWTAHKDFNSQDETDDIQDSIMYFQPSHKAFIPNMKSILKKILTMDKNKIKIYLNCFSSEQIKQISSLSEYSEVLKKIY